MTFRGKLSLFVVALLLLALTSCEKINLDDYLSPSEKVVEGDGFTVTFCVDNYEISDFDTYGSYPSRASKTVAELGSRLNFAIYQDGTRVQQVNQQSTDDDFGTITLNLSEGNYEVAILVHSCDGNATMTSTEKVTFPNNKVTDTFTYYTYMEVTSDNTYNISLHRCVAMYRFTIESEIPEEVRQMKFYYTGGSSTLDITTGFGSVNSRQTEYRDVVSHEKGQTFELYTFPHDVTDELKMTVTALDSSGESYHEVVYENVPVEQNMITNHSTDFFNGSSGGETGSGVQFSLRGDDDWSGEMSY